jgi:multidrug efflux pump subunit AcrA (membrane-fusion protein)
MSVSFSESDIGKVKVGQAATVTVSAADDAKLAARVTKVGLVATTSNSVVSYPVELTVTQKSAGVLAGMSATAEIVVEQATGVITVPTQALSGRSVTVVKDGEKTTRSVTTGIAGDSTTQIVSGLTAGEVIALPTLSTTSSTAASTSTTSRRSGATGLAGGTAGGFGGGTGGGFPGGGTGGPPTR